MSVFPPPELLSPGVKSKISKGQRTYRLFAGILSVCSLICVLFIVLFICMFLFVYFICLASADSAYGILETVGYIKCFLLNCPEVAVGVNFLCLVGFV